MLENMQYIFLTDGYSKLVESMERIDACHGKVSALTSHNSLYKTLSLAQMLKVFL